MVKISAEEILKNLEEGNLEEINYKLPIIYNHKTWEQICGQIAISKKLTHLFVEKICLKFDDPETNLSKLMEALKINKTLQSLTITGFDLGNWELVRPISSMLSENTTIRELDLSNNRITTSGFINLMYGLEQAEESSLRSLILIDNKINEAEWESLHPIEKMINLKSLCLDGNKLASEGLYNILKILSLTDTIHDLSINECFGTEPHPQDISRLAKQFNIFLAKNKRLENLYIDGNFLGDDNFANILILLLKNRINLESLSASSNQLTELSLPYITRLVSNTCGLNELILNDNLFEGADLRDFLQALIRKNKLLHLELGGPLDDSNISQIASFLKVSKKISYLNLLDEEDHENEISEVNVLKLFKAIQTNTSLDTLRLPFAELTSKTVYKIAKIYSQHSSLNNCYFSYHRGKSNADALTFYKTAAQHVLKMALKSDSDKDLLSSKLTCLINNIFNTDEKEVDKFKLNTSKNVLNAFNIFMINSYTSISSKEEYQGLLRLQKTTLHILNNYEWLLSTRYADTKTLAYSLYTRGNNMYIIYNIQEFLSNHEESIKNFIPFLENNLKLEDYSLNYYSHVMRDFINKNINRFQVQKLGKLVSEVQNLLTGEAAQSWKYIFDKVNVRELEVDWVQTVKRRKLNDGNFSPCDSL
jgi:hypothetical protein